MFSNPLSQCCDQSFWIEPSSNSKQQKPRITILAHLAQHLFDFGLQLISNPFDVHDQSRTIGVLLQLAS
jgi:hypothetical protein